MTAKKKAPAKRVVKKAAKAKPKTAAKKPAEPPKFGTPEWRAKYAKKKR